MVQQIIIFMTMKKIWRPIKMASQMLSSFLVPSKTMLPKSYPLNSVTKRRPLRSRANKSRPLRAQTILIKMMTKTSVHANRTNAWFRKLRATLHVVWQGWHLKSNLKKLIKRQLFQPQIKELEKWPKNWFKKLKVTTWRLDRKLRDRIPQCSSEKRDSNPNVK